MAGPTPMALGGYHFQALGFHMTDLSRNLETPWAELDVAMRFDAAQWTGPKSDSITIGGVLFPEEFGGMGSLAGIAAAARSGRPLTLVTGSGDVGGLMRVEGISEDWSYIDANGRPRRDAYKISMKKLAGSSFGGGGLAALTGLVGALVGGMAGMDAELNEVSGLITDAAAAGGLAADDVERLAGRVGVSSFDEVTP